MFNNLSDASDRFGEVPYVAFSESECFRNKRRAKAAAELCVLLLKLSKQLD